MGHERKQLWVDRVQPQPVGSVDARLGLAAAAGPARAADGPVKLGQASADEARAPRGRAERKRLGHALAGVDPVEQALNHGLADRRRVPDDRALEGLGGARRTRERAYSQPTASAKGQKAGQPGGNAPC